MFEYVCEHVIPGCTTREQGDTPEAVREEARRHLHEHHGTEYLDEALEMRIGAAIFRLPG
jgi:predicted RNase H-like HicB family nuclease